ncbi:hypothetical protein FHT00_003484 [Sphingomonas insulae]|nr:hypothetical protein [Sphingomonas insulae]NIJ31504.1 hypothetical protein [Sphingomonas insulae]
MARRPNSKRARRGIDRGATDQERHDDAPRDTLWQRVRRWWRVIRTGF